MTVSIFRVGYLYRWIVKAGARCSGGMTSTWEQALTEATETAESIRRVAVA
jgi:hypothetical protein